MLSSDSRGVDGAVKVAARAVTQEAAGRATKPKDTRQVEAFSERETGSAYVHGIARDQLRAFIERIERLEEEKKTVADDIKDVYGEAKGMGYDTKVMKKVIALRKKDDQERMEEDLVLDTYLMALGMIVAPSDGDAA